MTKESAALLLMAIGMLGMLMAGSGLIWTLIFVIMGHTIIDTEILMSFSVLTSLLSIITYLLIKEKV